MVQLKAVTLTSLPPNSFTSSSPLPPATKGRKTQELEKIVLLPDRILHPQFHPRKVGKGIWLTLDARVYAQLGKKAAYKALNNRAVLMDGMEGLVWEQLGERCVQEVELLVERFAARKRIDLILGVGEVGKCLFTIRLDESEDEVSECTVFTPNFKDEAQKERFKNAIQKLASIGREQGEVAGKGKGEYRFRQSNITVGLGVALYRLKMWSRSTQAAKAASQSVSRPQFEGAKAKA